MLNQRQRQRRAQRNEAARRVRTGTRLEQSVPCALGDHRVSIALHRDGSLLSIHSECFDSPPSAEERAVVSSLVGADKFLTCADTVRHVLAKVGGGDHLERSEGFPYNPTDLLVGAGARPLNALIANLNRASKGPRPYKGNFRHEHQAEVLLKLSQSSDHEGEPSDGHSRKWLGHLAGVETRLKVLSRGDGDGKYIVAQARTVRSSNFQTIAIYLGKGRFKINSDAIASAARVLTPSYSRHTACLVCARNFTSVKAHARSKRHRDRWEGVVYDNLTILGSRLYRNQ